jgi:saccharopine dehydrogenase-like NADP-dependent oxidoreductase
MKRVLVLGAGLVARPLLRYFLTLPDYRLVVASDDPARAERQMGEHPRGRVVSVDARDPAALAPLFRECDAVVSLLPAELNPGVARLAIAHAKPLVNTSYVSEEIRALDRPARDAGVLILCEMGLDPGLDHMTAAATIRGLRFAGGTVTGFQSACGGFPAQDANTNPWGYKFSWRPQAAMAAGLKPARYLKDGEEITIPAGEAFRHRWPIVIDGRGVFEVYPNRDALSYREAYGLGAARGIFRGTLRYPGWCETMAAAGRLDLLDREVRPWPAGTTYREFSSRLVGGGQGPCLLERVADFLQVPLDSEVLARLEWAGLFSDRLLPEREASPFDVFCNRLFKLMIYQPGERDLVVLKHVITVTFPDGSREEVRCQLTERGERWGDTAMARTVSLCAGIGTRLILEKGIQAVGVQIPTLREIYEPVLAELAERGVAITETHLQSVSDPLSE